MNFIDLAAQQRLIVEKLNANIAKVLAHGQYINGPEVRELENALAVYVGVRHAVGCASGTDALLMALMALDIGPGDAVFTTPFTFIATAEVISLLGAMPVFVDIDFDTINMDVDKIEAAITPRTKAIIVVHLHGLAVDMDRLLAVARRLLTAHAAAQQPPGDVTRGESHYNWARIGGLRPVRGATLGIVGLGEIGVDDDPERHGAGRMFDA